MAIDLTPAERFNRLVEFCRSGGRLPRPVVDQILQAADKTDRDLVGVLVVGGARPTSIPGDPCECGGVLGVMTSRRRGEWREQYLRCDTCKRSAGKRLVPEATIRRRRSKRSN